MGRVRIDELVEDMKNAYKANGRKTYGLFWHSFIFRRHSVGKVRADFSAESPNGDEELFRRRLEQGKLQRSDFAVYGRGKDSNGNEDLNSICPGWQSTSSFFSRR